MRDWHGASIGRYGPDMPVTLDQTRAHLDRLATARRQRLDRLAKQIRARLPDAAHLARQQGAQQVWLFGSVVHGDLDEDSDVDLAVAGLPAHRHTTLHIALTDLLQAPVDLVRLEQAPESLRQTIERWGIPL